MERGMKLDKTIELKTVFLSWRQTMRDSYIHQDSRAKAQLVTRIFDTCLSFSLSFVHFSCSSWTADTAEAVSSRVGSALVPKRLQLDAVRRIEVAVWIAVSYRLVCLYQRYELWPGLVCRTNRRPGLRLQIFPIQA